MRRIWTEVAAILLAVMVLGGCATSKDQLLPHGDNTMLDVWQHETGGRGAGGQAARQLLDARQSLRRPLTEADVQATPTTNAVSARIQKYPALRVEFYPGTLAARHAGGGCQV